MNEEVIYEERETFMDKIESLCHNYADAILISGITLVVGLFVWIVTKAVNRAIDNGNPIFGGYVPIFCKKLKK